MRAVSKRFAIFTLLIVLTAQGAFAAPTDENRSWGARVRHLIVRILDQLGVPGA